MSENKNSNSNWNFGIMAAAAVVATGLAYYFGYENGSQDCHEQMHRQQPGASSNSHSTPSFATNRNPEGHEECSICLKKMRPVKRLNCGHSYHDMCISEWLPINSVCPLCRAPQ